MICVHDSLCANGLRVCVSPRPLRAADYIGPSSIFRRRHLYHASRRVNVPVRLCGVDSPSSVKRADLRRGMR